MSVRAQWASHSQVATISALLKSAMDLTPSPEIPVLEEAKVPNLLRPYLSVGAQTCALLGSRHPIDFS